MNKKIIIFFVSILIIGFIFYLLISKLKKIDNEDWHELSVDEIAKYEPAENYKIEKDRVINDNINLSFNVLEDWKAEIREINDKTEIKITSPDFIAGINFPKKGCEISVGAVHFLKDESETKPKIIKKILLKEEETNESQEIINLDNKPALKTIKYNNENSGQIITTEKPFNNSLYFFNATFSQENRVECVERYDEFLKLIKIK